MTCPPNAPWCLVAALSVAFGMGAPPVGAQEPDIHAKIIAPAKLAAGGKGTVVVELTLGADWHVNSHTPSETFLIPTDLALAASIGTLSPVRYPRDVERRFPFSEKPLRVYEGTVRFEADLELPASAVDKVSVEGRLAYQACNSRQCFAPAKVRLDASIVIARP